MLFDIHFVKLFTCDSAGVKALFLDLSHLLLNKWVTFFSFWNTAFKASTHAALSL